MEIDVHRTRPVNARRRAFRVRRGQQLCAGVLAVLALVCAAPGAAQIVQEVVSIVAGTDCCDDACDDGDEQSCPGTCGHCACCAHPNVLPPPTQLQLAGRLVRELKFSSHGDRPDASGYRTPPFRPPTA